MAKERVGKLEGRAIELTQSKQERKMKIKINLCGLWYNKQPHIFGIPDKNVIRIPD